LELEPTQKAELISQAAEDRRALDIIVMDMRPVTTICDYFVICHGRSPQHLQAISEEIQKQMREHDIPPNHVEGSRQGGWILMDYLHVVVHIFTEESRRMYDLQRLWPDAEVISGHYDG
jgi:ribosome-associated protein